MKTQFNPQQIADLVSAYDSKMPAVIGSAGAVISDATQEILENDPESAGRRILDLECASSPLITLEQVVPIGAGPTSWDYMFPSSLTGGGPFPAHLFALDLGFQMNTFDLSGSNMNVSVSFYDQNRQVIPSLTQTISGTLKATEGDTKPAVRLFPYMRATAASSGPAPVGGVTYTALDATVKNWAIYNPLPIVPLVETDSGGVPDIRATDIFGVGAITGISFSIPASGVKSGINITVTPITWGWREASLDMAFAFLGENVSYKDMLIPDVTPDSFLSKLP